MVQALCKFTVTYGNRVARFSSLADAREWAQHMARMGGYDVEVRDASGLVAQFESNGELTAEFAHLRSAPSCFEAEARS